MIIKHDFGNSGGCLADRNLGQRSRSHDQPISGGRLLLGFDMVARLLFHANFFDASMILPFARFDGLDQGRFDLMAPSVILSPLVMGRFDAMDAAARLCALGYAGRYYAVVESVPSASLIRREMREAFPALDFDVLQLDNDDLPRLP